MPLQFDDAFPGYEPNQDRVRWFGYDRGRLVRCELDRAAPADLYGASGLSREDRVIIFNRHRDIILPTASRKFDLRLTEPDGSVIVTTDDLRPYHGKFGPYQRTVQPRFAGPQG
jgi:hypothetical protein